MKHFIQLNAVAPGTNKVKPRQLNSGDQLAVSVSLNGTEISNHSSTVDIGLELRIEPWIEEVDNPEPK